MRVETTYKEVLKNYLNAIKQLKEKKSQSKAKAAKESLGKYKFFYEVCRRIDSPPLTDALSNRVTEKRMKTLQERVDYSNGRSAARVTASLSKAVFSSNTLKSLPQIVIDNYRKTHEEEIKEEKRIDSLTPEERQVETEKALRQLRGTSGFSKFQISKM